MTNLYIQNSPNFVSSGTTALSINGHANWGNEYVQIAVAKNEGISPVLYFKYIKKKFKLLERRKMRSREIELEAAFNAAAENGQNMLCEKILESLIVAARETAMYAKGINKYLSIDDAKKYKNRLNSGCISDTMLAQYTRIIPKHVLKRKKELDGIFDDYVIYHYWNESQKDVKEMSHNEKTAMKDPILFGLIKENNNLYYVADWEDEYCDLTFDKMIKVLGKDSIGKITKKVATL